jgi:hypothetical protein
MLVAKFVRYTSLTHRNISDDLKRSDVWEFRPHVTEFLTVPDIGLQKEINAEYNYKFTESGP